MTSTILRGILMLPFIAFSTLSAQSTKVEVYTAEQLTASAASPAKPPVKPGDPPGVLEHYPNHYTMLITRHEDGQSELHEHVADVFFVASGKAQLWTGGSMQDGKSTGPGERRGSGLSGGTAVSLKRGDVVHIPANVPHQLRLAHGSSFTYFVVKVQEECVSGTPTPPSH